MIVEPLEKPQKAMSLFQEQKVEKNLETNDISVPQWSKKAKNSNQWQ